MSDYLIYHEFRFCFVLPPSLRVRGRGFWEVGDVLRDGPDRHQAVLTAAEKYKRCVTNTDWNSLRTSWRRKHAGGIRGENLHGEHAEGLRAASGQAAPGHAVHRGGVSEALQAAPARAGARVGARVRTRPQLHRLLFGAGEQDPTSRTPLHTGDRLL